MQPAQITPAPASDHETLGRAIGTAFAQDPIASWIFHEPDEIIRTFQHLARHIYLPRGLCHLATTSKGLVGGTMWLPPGASPEISLSAMLSLGIPALFRRGPAQLIRALRADAAMQRHHPKPPHYYLFTVGVLPEARGQGLARQLLAPILARCDAEKSPAYLENSNAKNTHLYESLGFVSRDPFPPAPTCPTMTPMWRTPR
jgi:ribosomal protein S18 acetylase RimI-like enzyme